LDLTKEKLTKCESELANLKLQKRKSHTESTQQYEDNENTRNERNTHEEEEKNLICPAQEFINNVPDWGSQGRDCPKDKRTYRKLARSVHPDKNKDCLDEATDLFKRLNNCSEEPSVDESHEESYEPESEYNYYNEQQGFEESKSYEPEEETESNYYNEQQGFEESKSYEPEEEKHVYEGTRKRKRDTTSKKSSKYPIKKLKLNDAFSRKRKRNSTKEAP
jgi:hypothetical protein